MNRATNPYAGYRYPAEIISHAVWLYFRFTLSFRDIEELLAARGILVTYETIRQGCDRNCCQSVSNLGDFSVDTLPIRLPFSIGPFQSQGQHGLGVGGCPPHAGTFESFLNEVTVGAFDFP